VNPDPTPFAVAMSTLTRGGDPASIMAAGEGASVLLAHDVKADDPRAVNLPVHITGGSRADLEALGFVWQQEPPVNPEPAAYVAVVPPEYWTTTVESMHRTVIHDERGVMRVLVYDNHQWWDRFAKTEVQNVGRSAVYTLVRDETATLASVRWHALTADEQATGLAELRELYERDLPVERANHWLARLEPHSPR